MVVSRIVKQVARSVWPDRSYRFASRDFTRHQLVANLVLRHSLKMNQCGSMQVVADLSGIRQLVDVKERRHYASRTQARDRLLEQGTAVFCGLGFTALCPVHRYSFALAVVSPGPSQDSP